ncbi:hypothetical protein ES288_A03G001000v1 [Gossypium darwinii]|uniref:Uncharacterized protein n=1 Tax=Gossypium darwinii TaxID=34276 RepID=A0A5D2GYG0_GOSDA|nr:hypothetical protein ES288_A03G001000v1 [Gossypium darwinii]
MRILCLIFDIKLNCGDENLMNTPAARHKSGCKYKKSKCLK